MKATFGLAHGEFENYEAISVGKEFISNKVVMLKNTPERMYVATGGGLMSYDYKSQQFVDRTNNEYKSWAHSINAWTGDEVWMSTDEGIFNYNVQTERQRGKIIFYRKRCNHKI